MKSLPTFPTLLKPTNLLFTKMARLVEVAATFWIFSKWSISLQTFNRGTKMAEIARLRNYRHYLEDGKSWAEFGCKDKQEVFIALILGVEPKKIETDEDYLNIDDIILGLAERIQKQRAADLPKTKTKKKKKVAT